MKIEERLTDRLIGVADIKPDQTPLEAFNRLAAYEDTGLLPEEVEAMRQKQIPKPTDKEIADSEEPADRCPECFAFVVGEYCHKCGQRLKWQD